MCGQCVCQLCVLGINNDTQTQGELIDVLTFRLCYLIVLKDHVFFTSFS